MDYKKFIIRSFTSFFLLSICFFLFNYQQTFILQVIRILYFLIFLEIIIFFNFKKILSLCYLFSSLLFTEIYFYLYFDINYFLYFILLIIIFDIFSYIFGSILGKKRIFPNISPGKTYVGLFYGFIISFVFSHMIYYFYFTNLPLFIFNFLSILIILSSFFGDIFQSYLKRQSNLKDSSNFLPGHGGFFDRFDGFILSSFLLPFIGFLL